MKQERESFRGTTPGISSFRVTRPLVLCNVCKSFFVLLFLVIVLFGPSVFGHCVVCPSVFGRCVVCPSVFGHCVVCPSAIYGFRLPLKYLQTLLLMAVR